MEGFTVSNLSLVIVSENQDNRIKTLLKWNAKKFNFKDISASFWFSAMQLGASWDSCQ